MLNAELRAENYFRDNYVDEFVGLFLFLETFKKSIEQKVPIVQFNTWYKNTKKSKGHIVLSFSKKFSAVPVPRRYAKEISKLDKLVGTINDQVDQLYKIKTVNKIDEILAAIRKVSIILKSVAVKK